MLKKCRNHCHFEKVKKLFISKLFWFGLTLFLFQNCNPKKNKPLSVQQQIESDYAGCDFRILSYGAGVMVDQNAYDVIGKKYGIRYIKVYGCDVPEAFYDSVGRHNDDTHALITEKYGEFFYYYFVYECRKEAIRQEKVKKFLNTIRSIKWKEEALKIKNNYLTLKYYIRPSQEKDIYSVQFYVMQFNEQDTFLTINDYGFSYSKIYINCETGEVKYIVDN